MSASDDTRKKLIDSIRKTKQTAGSKPASAGAAKSAPAATPKRARKAPTRKRAATKSASVGASGYEAGRRVWPD